MPITYEKVQDLSATISLKFDEGLKSRQPVYKSITETIPSNGDSNIYPIGEIPGIREFVGDRVLNEIKEHQHIVVNKTWEGSIKVPRSAIEDDNYGFYAKQAEKLGLKAAEHPDRLLAKVILDGFTEDKNGEGYDKVPFFSDKHPHGPNGTTQSNIIEGDGEPWILIDQVNGFAFVYQPRVEVKLEKPEGLSDMTFMKNIYPYGTYARYAMGNALWQSACGSKAPLSAENYEKAVKMMASIQQEEGEFLGIVPTHIVVGPKNKGVAKKLFKALLINGGESNTNYEDVEIIYLPYLSGLPAKSPTVPSDDLDAIKTDVSKLKTKVTTVESTANEAKTLATKANNRKAKDIIVDPVVKGKANVQEVLEATVETSTLYSGDASQDSDGSTIKPKGK